MSQPQASPQSRRARRGTTCFPCRRMKLRCDAGKQFPAPCTRCATAGRGCSLGMVSQPRDMLEDPSVRIAQLERDLRDLRRSLQSSGSGGSLNETTSTPSPSTTQSKNDETYASSSASAVEIAAQMGLSLQTQSLGSVDISPQEFLRLVDAFFTHFHPQLPFLASKRAVIRDALASPLLFWAIVTIAARASPSLENIRLRLTWPVRRLAAQSILQARSLSVVQTLLLLCLWPLPYAALIDDPSWMYCGVAIQKTLQMGLYRPMGVLMQLVKGDEETAHAMQTTWIVSFVVSQILSDRFGIPPSISIEQMTLLRPDSTARIPPILKAAGDVARKDSAISTLLFQHHATSISRRHFLPILKAFASELEDLESRLRYLQSPLLDRLLSSIKLRLYSHALLPSDIVHDGQTTPSLDERLPLDSNPVDMANYVSKAYSIAMHIINTSLDGFVLEPVDGDALNGQDRQPSPSALWTFMDQQSFVMAVFTLLHISRKHQNLSDNKEVSDAIQRAWSMLKSCSVTDGDHIYRVCEIISYLASKTPVTESDEPTPLEGAVPTLRPSMGAAVAYGMVKEARKRYRRRHWFPEQFPEVDANGGVVWGGEGPVGTDEAGETDMEAGSSNGGTEDWLHEELPQSVLADFDFMPWTGSWDENVVMGGGLPIGFH